jgi:UDP-3-O-[3-hydroxymyristoyl] glucosamine N-acyltransferase
MNFKASVIAGFLKGEIVGDPEVEVHDISKIEEGKPGTLSFLANPKYEKYLYDTQASIVLINKDFQAEKPVKATLIRVQNAYEAFASLLDLYDQSKPQKKGIHKTASIHDGVSLGNDLYIGDYTVIESNSRIDDQVKIYPQVYIGDNVSIGKNTIIYAGVKIYGDTKIGANCVIHSGAVIGADGFGFAPQEGNNYRKVPQIGNVIIEDNVEIGANTTIDRATMGSTIIRKGVKLDNLIQVAHNVEIGENTVIAAQSGVAGSTHIGKDCMIAGQVGIIGHLRIADKVKIAAQSGVMNSVKKEGEILQGSSALPFKNYWKSYVIFSKLPEIRNQINEMERDIKELKKDK